MNKKVLKHFPYTSESIYWSALEMTYLYYRRHDWIFGDKNSANEKWTKFAKSNRPVNCHPDLHGEVFEIFDKELDKGLRNALELVISYLNDDIFKIDNNIEISGPYSEYPRSEWMNWNKERNFKIGHISFDLEDNFYPCFYPPSQLYTAINLILDFVDSVLPMHSIFDEGRETFTNFGTQTTFLLVDFSYFAFLRFRIDFCVKGHFTNRVSISYSEAFVSKQFVVNGVYYSRESIVDYFLREKECQFTHGEIAYLCDQSKQYVSNTIVKTREIKEKLISSKEYIKSIAEQNIHEDIFQGRIPGGVQKFIPHSATLAYLIKYSEYRSTKFSYRNKAGVEIFPDISTMKNIKNIYKIVSSFVDNVSSEEKIEFYKATGLSAKMWEIAEEKTFIPSLSMLATSAKFIANQAGLYNPENPMKVFLNPV